MAEPNQYLYKIQPSRPKMLSDGATPEEDAIVDEHFEYLKDLLAQGVLILAGRTLNSDPTSFGIVIFKAGSLPEAIHIMGKDPAVSKGVMLADLFPYRVALMGKV
jgi:uncharacterized protein YciI